MSRLIFRRLAALPVILLLTAIIVFLLVWMSPYDPAEAYVMSYGPGISQQLRLQYAEAWGLNRSLPQQFTGWLSQLLRGDFGQSRLLAGQSVAEVIAGRAGATLLLVGASLVVALVGGLVAGVFAGALRGSWIDWLVRTAGYFAVFAPSFWIALLLLYFFSIKMSWLPAGGIGDLRTVVGPRFQWSHMILPLATLAMTQHAWFTLYVRNALLEVMREDYIRFAQAQGVGRVRVLFRHALPNALIPFVTLVGTHIPELIGGSVLIESIFGWPGLGSLTRQAALAVDIPLLLAIILLGAVAVVVGNLAADILYRVLDPRIREAIG